MNGADFIATVRLSTLKNETLAAIGETCERVPASSLGWLAAQGLIQQAPQATPKAAKRVTGAKHV